MTETRFACSMRGLRARFGRDDDRRDDRHSDAGFSLIEVLVAMTLGLILLGGVATLIIVFTKSSARTSADAVARRELKAATSQMSSDITRASRITPLANKQGYLLSVSTKDQDKLIQYTLDGTTLYRYTATGAPGALGSVSDLTAPPTGVTAIRVPVSHGIDTTKCPKDAAGAVQCFAYYNDVSSVLDASGTKVVNSTTALPGSSESDKNRAVVNRVTWNLTENYGKYAKASARGANDGAGDLVSTQGGNSRANRDADPISTGLDCTPLTVTSSGAVPVVSWNGVGGADFYDIYRNGSKIARVDDADRGSFTYRDEALAKNAIAAYSLAVGNNSGRSIVCKDVFYYVPAPVISGAYTPSATDSASGAGTFDITWPAVVAPPKFVIGAGTGAKTVAPGTVTYNCVYDQIDYTSGAIKSATHAESGSLSAAKWSRAVIGGEAGRFVCSATYTVGGNPNSSGGSNVVKLQANPATPQMVSQNFGVAASDTVANPSEFPVSAPDANVPVTATDFTSGTGENTLHWYATPNTAGYHLYSKTTNRLIQTVAQPDGAVTSGAKRTMLDSRAFKAAWGSTTQYYVTSYNDKLNADGINESGASNTKAVLQYPPAPPITANSGALASGTPATTVTTDGNGYNMLAWGKVRTDTGKAPQYLVQKAYANVSSNAVVYVSAGPSTTDAFYKDVSVNSGSKTSYKVRAHNDTGDSWGYSAAAVIIQHPAAPATPGDALTKTCKDRGCSRSPTITSNSAAGNIAQNADAGNPSSMPFCSTLQQTCKYRFMINNVVCKTVPGNDAATVSWNSADRVGNKCPDNNYGKSYSYAVESYNGANYSLTGSAADKGWSAPHSFTVDTFPGLFDIRNIGTAQMTPQGSGKQYTYDSGGEGTENFGNNAATVDLGWTASAGDGVVYRWRAWPVKKSIPGFTAFAPGQTRANYPVDDGGNVYYFQVQSQSDNGLTRGGSDPTTAKCIAETPDQLSTCAAAFQASPAMPRRLAIVQQFDPSANSSGNAKWAVKYFVDNTPMDEGDNSSGYSNYDINFGWDRKDRSCDSHDGSDRKWYSASSDIHGTTTSQYKGNNGCKSTYNFYVQSRSTRGGVINPNTYSTTLRYQLISGNSDAWADGGVSGSGVRDAAYNRANYPSSYGHGIIRYGIKKDEDWSVDDGDKDPVKPGTHWTRNW